MTTEAVEQPQQAEEKKPEVEVEAAGQKTKRALLRTTQCVSEGDRDSPAVFRPSATKSGRPYGVATASSWRTPSPWLADPPGITQSHNHVMDGWGTQPLR